jgi:hypothetical protein
MSDSLRRSHSPPTNPNARGEDKTVAIAEQIAAVDKAIGSCRDMLALLRTVGCPGNATEIKAEYEARIRGLTAAAATLRARAVPAPPKGRAA